MQLSTEEIIKDLETYQEPDIELLILMYRTCISCSLAWYDADRKMSDDYVSKASEIVVKLRELHSVLTKEN